MSFTYPQQLIEQIKTKWSKSSYGGENIPDLPNDEILEALLEVCYHASFLTEEQRGLAFRVIFCSKKDLVKKQNNDIRFIDRTRIIPFETTRDFSIGELMRLTPATDFKKVLIGVEKVPSRAKKVKLRVWGLLETGSSWWDFIHGESSGGGMPPPNYLTISSNRSGYLSVSRQGRTIVSLSAGQVSSPISNVLHDGPIGHYLDGSAQLFYNDVCKELESDSFDKEGPDNNYPQRKYIEYFERVLFHIRQLNHGGVLIVVPDHMDGTDPRITDRLTIKYPVNYNEGWGLLIKHLTLHRRYYDLHFPLWDGSEKLTKENYQTISMLESQKDDVHKALSDSVNFIASLSGVDGAVLITDKLRVLGFGCEVIAQSLSLKNAKISNKAKVTGKKKIALQNYGTRHRSTFRFCSSFDDSIAFIVSQDGGVKAVKRVGADLILWPDVNIG